MFKNSAVQLATGKIAGASLVPASLILIGGIVAWQLWQKQSKLQAQASEMTDDMMEMKKDLATLKVANVRMANAEASAAPISSFLKGKVSGINMPWSSSK